MGIKEAIKKNLLPILTVFSVVFGVVLGGILRYIRDEAWSPREVMYVGYIGELYLRALKALIIPLIVSSIIAAIGSLDLSLSKKIGLRAICYYISTTIFAVILGVVLVILIHPGRGSDDDITKVGSSKGVYTPDLLMDLPRNLFPPNLIQAGFETYKTIITPPDMTLNETQYLNEKYNLTEGELPPKHEWPISSEYVSSLNIIGLLVFSAALGVALSQLGEKGKPLLDVFISLSDASMVITGWLVWISPLGIIFLVASMMIKTEDFSIMLGQVGMYFLTVVVGIGIHGFLILPGLYILLVRKLPFRFIANMGQALITAFATSTSSGTLPVTMNCLEKLNGIDTRVTRFVVPIGATINMDATALYEAVAAIFIAQVRVIPLSIGQIIALIISSTLASIGTAGIPQGGLVTMVMVLDVVGLPAEDITLIIAVDWLLDRFQTSINILGDSFGAGIVYELSKNELEIFDVREGMFNEGNTVTKYENIESYESSKL